MFVLDTSVIMKWYINEEDSERAERILDNYKVGDLQIIEPDLLIYEFVNVLRYNKRFSSLEKIECIKSLYNLDIYFISPYYELMKNILTLSETKNITVYDATFVTLAQELGCEFITADKEMYKKVQELKFVKLLKDVNFLEVE